MTTVADRQRLAAHVAIGLALQERFKHRDELYFGASSLFLMPEAAKLAWLWVMDRPSNLSGVTQEWSNRDRPHRVHRLLLARDPREITNIYERTHWQRVLTTFCHLHLRDGAVLYVLFLDSTTPGLATVRRELNFSCFTSGEFFSLTGFWEDDYCPVPSVTGEKALLEMSRRLTLLPTDALRAAIRVWYDPGTFLSRRRPNDALYRAQRKLMCSIFGGVCQGPRGAPNCLGERAGLSAGHLDHILPIGIANSILLNLSWLCSPCNMSKGHTDIYALPLEYSSAVIPSHVATRDLLAEIVLDPPVWISRYLGPPEDVLRRRRPAVA